MYIYVHFIEKTEKSNMIPILAGVASAFVILLIIIAIWAGLKLFGGTGGKAIECPDFTKMTFAELQEHEYYKNNTFEFIKEEKYCDEHKRGEICEQSRYVGEKLKEGAKITITVIKILKTFFRKLCFDLPYLIFFK